jgi:plasmid stability protein
MAQLQIRDVPSDLHRKLRARAANIGQSLSEYVLDELARSIERSEELDRLLESDPAAAADDDVVVVSDVVSDVATDASTD